MYLYYITLFKLKQEVIMIQIITLSSLKTYNLIAINVKQ